MPMGSNRNYLRAQNKFTTLNNMGSKWKVKLGFFLMTILLVSIIFYIEQKSSDQYFNELSVKIKDKVTQLEKFKNNLELIEFKAASGKMLTNDEKRVRKIVKTKVRILIKTMKDEGLENVLKNFYMKGERKYSIVLSKWRSGSSFFGDFLQSVPGSFYHYEPLINKVNILDSAKVQFGIDRVKNFLQCNYTNVPDYLRFIRLSVDVYKNAVELKNVYNGNEDIATTEDFVSSVCKVYPFQHSKVIRLKLDNFREVLDHNEMNLKIVLLIRDPRAVMSSRKNLVFCQRTIDCKHPNFLCENMVRDFYTAKRFMEKYPNNIRIVRYEDWMLDLIPKSKKLLEFYGLPFTKNTESFLLEHTSRSDMHPFSTFRNPNMTLSMWMEKLNYEEVSFIQSTCMEAMSLWGYHYLTAQDFKEKKNPVLSYDEFEL